ncbi:carbohydrate ABC transporter permease [Halanaerobium kushneri]|uniref:Carbohydrate ABC transporter membrane protein 2, CUT1 family n=1 Tax=Halanaerobium kushneri TaxID=56779 RepID=A0A1N6VI00_9FIRM|nr:carbohydrate ABC transporter permease [Halanaerobium kushneri]SIQ77465.1 carbohydrate ABC transporter membrane protein 2, CUT1 family [Halanaerobium kushneri]
MENKTSPTTKVLKYSFSYLLAVLFIFPILWMLFASLKPSGYHVSKIIEWFLPPYSFVNYSDVIAQAPVLKWMLNSLIVSASVTLIVIIFDSLAAFALSVIDFKYKNLVFVLFTIGLMVPTEANVVALFDIVQKLGLINTYPGLILPRIAIPLGIIILKEFFDAIPRDLIDSARIDGCGLFRIYYSIFMPLSKAAIASIGIFTFIQAWNAFLWPFIAIMTKEMFTLPVGVPTFTDAYTPDYSIPMTVNMIASLPAIAAFLLFQKQIIQGIKFTGIKG